MYHELEPVQLRDGEWVTAAVVTGPVVRVQEDPGVRLSEPSSCVKNTYSC